MTGVIPTRRVLDRRFESTRSIEEQWSQLVEESHHDRGWIGAFGFDGKAVGGDEAHAIDGLSHTTPTRLAITRATGPVGRCDGVVYENTALTARRWTDINAPSERRRHAVVPPAGVDIVVGE
jgi:hypothetical protein